MVVVVEEEGRVRTSGRGRGCEIHGAPRSFPPLPFFFFLPPSHTLHPPQTS